MASIAVVGKSGTGKSTSFGQFPELHIKGLDPKKTVVINVSGKDLPFRGWKKLYTGAISAGGNYFESSDALQISKAIEYVSASRPDIDNIVIDDAQYIMAFEFMRRAKENGYGKFADIGVNLGKVVEAARITRRNLKVYFLWHPENDRENGYKMKTVGNMVDSYLTLEGLFTVILYTKVSKGNDNKIKYEFVTNHDGEFPAKSPVGMFTELYIPNDLGLVSETIDKYNEGE
jgi:hypothetical protein